MPGRSAKKKGQGGEYEFRDLCRKNEIPAEKVPGSGAFQGLPVDVSVLWTRLGLHHNWLVEVKRHKKHKVMACALKYLNNGSDVFVSRADNDLDPILTMKASTFFELMELIIKKEGYP